MEVIPHPKGPGNALGLKIESEHMPGVFKGFGERSRPAEEVAQEAIETAKLWLKEELPVDEYLAGQLLQPMALAGGGSFRAGLPTLHNPSSLRGFSG